MSAACGGPAAIEGNVTGAVTAELADRPTQTELEMEAGRKALEGHPEQPSLQSETKQSPAKRQTILFRDYETRSTLDLKKVEHGNMQAIPKQMFGAAPMRSMMVR